VDSALAQEPPVAPAAVADAVAEPDALLKAARSGRMPLPELLDRAGALQAGGEAERAAALYDAWLASTARRSSPPRVRRSRRSATSSGRLSCSSSPPPRRVSRTAPAS